jgi:hypothetical protein
VGAIHLHVTVGADDQKVAIGYRAREVDEQVEGAVIGVVEILEHQQDRLPTCGIPQEGDDTLQQAPALVLGMSVRTRLDLQPQADVGGDARHLGCARAEISLQLPRLRTPDIIVDGLDERQVGQR